MALFKQITIAFAKLMDPNCHDRTIPNRCSASAAFEHDRGNLERCSRVAYKCRNSLAWSTYPEWLGSLLSCWAVQSERKQTKYTSLHFNANRFEKKSGPKQL